MRADADRGTRTPAVIVRPASLLAPLPLLGGALGLLATASVLFSGGSDDNRLFCIGGVAIVCAAAAAVAVSAGAVVIPALSPLGLAAAGFFVAFVVWEGFSILWSIEADRSWNYFHRGLVYVA